MKLIALTQGKSAIVDDEDFEYLSKWKWHYANGYARRVENFGSKGGKRIRKMVLMHRVVNKTPDGLFTDHINGDRLDNRQSNLRPCNYHENSRNRGAASGAKSKFKGVFWRKNRKVWQASLGIDGKLKHIGYFKSEADAATAYNLVAEMMHGEFARMNTA